ncbi:LysR substrate-binding domain-containing protein [Klebsiella michiganensis]|jgi:DNA-binding transcriptional LysR family regulator|nr:LysR substrate-binding domain-containing protein [Klebsiella michiganensis]
MICNTSAALLDVARAGLGIACLPDFMVQEAIDKGELVTVLDEHTEHHGTLRLFWPSSKYLSPKLRVFIDFMVEQIFAQKNFRLTQE